jgi:phosphoglycolate phosphatase
MVILAKKLGIFMKNKKLIIFDLDGTLIDSAPSLTNALNLMLKKLNKQSVSEDRVREWIGEGASKLVARAYFNKKDIKDDEIIKTKDALNIFLEYYQKSLTKNLKLYSGVKEGLKDLSKNYKLAIATNKPHIFLDEILNYLDIKKFFSEVLGAKENLQKKPNPNMLLKILKNLEIKPSSAVMIGDSKSDLLAASNANIESIFVTYGYNQNLDIKNYKVAYICDNFKEVTKLFV